MILTVNIHPTAIKVARSGQGGRNVSLEFPDASGSTLASIFPGSAEGWNTLIAAARDGRARQIEADTDHAIAADVAGQTALPLWVVVERIGLRDIARTAAGTRLEADTFVQDCASDFAGQLKVIPARPGIDLDEHGMARMPLDVFGDEPKADPVPWPIGLCGHPVPPGAWAAGYTRCRDCTAALVSDPENLARFDEAAAPDLTVADDEARPEDLDDADGES